MEAQLQEQMDVEAPDLSFHAGCLDSWLGVLCLRALSSAVSVLTS